MAESQSTGDPREALLLKLDEPQVSQDQPWADDALSRDQLAQRLTNLIATQSSPFAISIHGNWGTGKTFLLKRWQAQLKRDGFEAIYFNAWEDDSSDDPLLAMLGQLAEHFSEEGVQAIAKQVLRTAVPLFRQNVLGLLEKHTGIALELQEQYKEKDFVDAYLQQRSTRDELKLQLHKLSAKVREDTTYPTVFIVDELDRCRPTFAIELLERVKHIFDVPDLVFVFGVNRDELCKSLESIYGQIDSDTYLRRFFDMEFTLSEPSDLEGFARHLIGKYGLIEFFNNLTASTNSQVSAADFRPLVTDFPIVWRYLDLSLRDIDHCVRSIAFVARNLDRKAFIYPWVLGTLITLKLQEPQLYRRYVQGDCRASDIINHLDERLSAQSLDRRVMDILDMIEAELYGAASDGAFGSPESARNQLKLLAAGESLTNPEVLSHRVQSGRNANRLVQVLQSDRWWHGATLRYIASLIDMYDSMARR